MARDPEEFDDRPARRDDRDADRPRRGGDPAAGRRKVHLPGTILMLLGLIATLLWLVFLFVAVTSPEALVNAVYENVSIPALEMTAPSKQRDQQIWDMKSQRDRAVVRAREKGPDPVGVLKNALYLIPSLLMLVGGMKMRAASGYVPAVVGAVVALLPCSNVFVCLTMPFGLWALITLLGTDARAAFAATKRGVA